MKLGMRSGKELRHPVVLRVSFCAKHGHYLLRAVAVIIFHEGEAHGLVFRLISNFIASLLANPSIYVDFLSLFVELKVKNASARLLELGSIRANASLASV
jgi:hypothetical protein